MNNLKSPSYNSKIKFDIEPSSSNINFLHLKITCDPHLTIEIFKLLWSELEEIFGLGLASLSDEAVEAVEAAVMDLDKVLSTKLLKPSW